MLFPTGEFLLLYLPVTLALFFLIARLMGPRAAALWLTVASLIFYGFWRPIHVLLLLASIVFNYWAGGLVLRERLAGNEARGRLIVGLVIAADLLVLAVFKYANFIVGSVSALTGSQLPALGLALPLGISFFTFTQIAYLVDVHAGKAVERSPIRYALFVTYFPHLVAGPVLHHSQMMPQFADARIYSPQLKGLASGMAFLVLGLCKKVLIADSFAPVANAVFTAAGAGPVSGAEAWGGALAYALQIYFDFSGYSDMAVGLSLLFNVRLPYNFNSPYKATSIIDFWRRWHMSLSTFLRDYLYFALGGNRRGGGRRYLILMTTMLLGGLWHGASWTFVVWGGLHGLYLVINHGWNWLCSRLSLTVGRGPLRWLAQGAAWLLTMCAVIVAWVFFRATDFTSAWTLLRAMFGVGGLPAPRPEWVTGGGQLWPWMALLMLFAGLAPNTQQWIDGALARWLDRRGAPGSLPVRALLVGGGAVLAIVLVAISESRSVTEFIYFNF